VGFSTPLRRRLRDPERLYVLGRLQPGQPAELWQRGGRQWRARALAPCERPPWSLAPAVVAAQP